MLRSSETMNMQDRAGLTLVELMLGMLTASILALTVGAMLVYNYQGMARSSSMAELERDAALAVGTLDSAVRAASNVVAATTNKLQVSAGGNNRTFSVVGRSLLYNPNGTSGGMVLITNRLSGFASRWTNAPSSEVFVTLNLFDSISGEAMLISNMCIRLRN